MSYTDTFSQQWDSLVESFKSDMCKLPAEEITLGRVSEWYRVNSFCWCSIVEPEGMMLDGQKNDELTRKLTGAIRSFAFEKAEVDIKRPKILPYLIAGAVAAVVICITLRIVFSVAIWKLVLLAMLIVPLSLAFLAPRIDRFGFESVSMIVFNYSRQLEDYKQKLLGICMEFEQDSEENDTVNE